MKYFVLSLFAICILTMNCNSLMAQQNQNSNSTTQTKATLARNAYKSEISPSQRTILHIGDVVNENEVIRTVGKNSYAAILLSSNLALRMSAYTTVEFNKIYNKSLQWDIDLRFGTIIVAANANAPTNIKIGDIVVSSKGALFAITHNVEKGTTSVSVLSGSVVVDGTTIGEFYTMNAVDKSVVTFGSNERSIFDDVENIPGITSVGNIGNFVQNSLALKQNKIDEIINSSASTDTSSSESTNSEYPEDNEDSKPANYEYEEIEIKGVSTSAAVNSDEESSIVAFNTTTDDEEVVVANDDVTVASIDDSAVVVIDDSVVAVANIDENQKTEDVVIIPNLDLVLEEQEEPLVYHLDYIEKDLMY